LNKNLKKMSEVTYYILHLDIFNPSAVLFCELLTGHSLADAIAALKHHPCALGELYSCAATTFDRTTAKLLVTKKKTELFRHNVDEQRKTFDSDEK